MVAADALAAAALALRRSAGDRRAAAACHCPGDHPGAPLCDARPLGDAGNQASPASLGRAHPGHGPLRSGHVSRVFYGGRVSLLIGVGAALVSVTLGLFIGLIAGFFRTADAIIMRIMDGLMAIPAILLAIALVDRKSTRLNSSHVKISYAASCLKKKT